MKAWASLAFLVAASASWAQATKPTPSVKRSAFYASSRALEKAMDATLGLPPVSVPAVTEPDSTVSREDIVVEFARLFKRYQSSFRRTPRPFPVDRQALAAGLAMAVQPEAENLVRWGLVPPVGPLVTGPGRSLTANQAGNALGYFFSRLSNLVYVAEPRWTPKLMSEDGD